MKILLTSTSFQDTPGKHHQYLEKFKFDIITKRGPLTEEEMLENIENIDGIICGDDYITQNVLKKGKSSKLKIISKYGIGLDKIDLNTAIKLKIPIYNCPGINKYSVAEHTFALLLNYTKNISKQLEITKKESWVRFIGTELFNKNISIIGLGNIGKLVADYSRIFGMNVYYHDKFCNTNFKNIIFKSMDEIFKISDVITLHLPLDEDSYHLLNKVSFSKMKRKPIIINTSRGDLVNETDVAHAIENNIIKSYLTDVLSYEPIKKNHPFSKYSNIQITPHVGSRTYESVERQAIMAIDNLVKNI